MKVILFTALFVIFFNGIFAQSKAITGMSMEEVKKLYSQTQSSAYENTITLSFNDTLYGLPGE